MKTNNTIFLLLIVIILLVVQQFLSYQLTNIPDVEFPFKNVKDQNNRNLNIMVITAPFRSDKDKDNFNKYVQKYNIPMLGMASYLNFPGEITHPYDDPYYKKNFKKHDYINSCIGWCHGFRDPKANGLDKSKIPVMELSESDLVIHTFKPSKKKDWDFIYVCLQDNKNCKYGWQAENRNWNLAKKCFPIMCDKYKLKGLLVGRLNCDYTPKCKDSLTIMGNKDNEGKLEYHDFMDKLSKSKFLFVPNIRDASPRVLTEALVVDVPVMVNEKIYGGWKYVNEKTGEFFNDENDFPKALEKMLQKIKQQKYQPRKWFTSRYSIQKTGKKLYDFIKKIYPEVWDAKYVSLTR